MVIFTWIWLGFRRLFDPKSSDKYAMIVGEVLSAHVEAFQYPLLVTICATYLTGWASMPK
jgi:hypothetical protein